MTAQTDAVSTFYGHTVWKTEDLLFCASQLIVRWTTTPSSRAVSQRALTELAAGFDFRAIDLRGFKLRLEDAFEDCGQVAVYRGTFGACR